MKNSILPIPRFLILFDSYSWTPKRFSISILIPIPSIDSRFQSILLWNRFRRIGIEELEFGSTLVKNIRMRDLKFENHGFWGEFTKLEMLCRDNFFPQKSIVFLIKVKLRKLETIKYRELFKVFLQKSLSKKKTESINDRKSHPPLPFYFCSDSPQLFISKSDEKSERLKQRRKADDALVHPFPPHFFGDLKQKQKSKWRLLKIEFLLFLFNFSNKNMSVFFEGRKSRKRIWRFGNFRGFWRIFIRFS